MALCSSKSSSAMTTPKTTIMMMIWGFAKKLTIEIRKTCMQAMTFDEHPLIVIFFDDIQWMDISVQNTWSNIFLEEDAELQSVLVLA